MPNGKLRSEVHAIGILVVAVVSPVMELAAMPSHECPLGDFSFTCQHRRGGQCPAVEWLTLLWTKEASLVIPIAFHDG